jgi:hypothetical protein
MCIKWPASRETEDTLYRFFNLGSDVVDSPVYLQRSQLDVDETVDFSHDFLLPVHLQVLDHLVGILRESSLQAYFNVFFVPYINLYFILVVFRLFGSEPEAIDFLVVEAIYHFILVKFRVDVEQSYSRHSHSTSIYFLMSNY